MPDLIRYQYKHLAAQESQRIWIRQAPKGMHVLLGRVVVNTGGDFILALYNGMESKEAVAVIKNPKAGQTLTYKCVLDAGLTCTLDGERDWRGNPYSVTITFADVQSA